MKLNIKKMPSSGKNYIRLGYAYRDPNKKYPIFKVLHNFGNEEDLNKLNPLFVFNLKKKVFEINKRKEINLDNINDKIDHIINELMNDTLSPQKRKLKKIFNFGYQVYEKIIDDLNIHEFFSKNKRKDIQKVINLLIYSKIMQPCSELKSYFNKDEFWNSPEICERGFYNALDFLYENKNTIEKKLNERISVLTNRKYTAAFYNLTTYYFESQNEDVLKKFGCSKDNKINKVQIVMGLLIDENGIPITYEIFTENTSNMSTLKSFIKKLKDEYGIQKIIIAADEKLDLQNSLSELKSQGFEYVIAYKLKASNKLLKSCIFDEKGYNYIDNEFKYKFIDLKKVNKSTELAQSKLLVFWSEKKEYSDFKKIKEKFKKVFSFDDQKVAEDFKYRGYYAIESSIKELSDLEIIEIYKSLEKIEESFGLLKNQFETKPIFSWKLKKIETHFCLCFISLIIQRYLEWFLKKEGLNFSTQQIIESLYYEKLRIFFDLGKTRFIKTCEDIEHENIANKIRQKLKLRVFPEQGDFEKI